MRRRSDLSLPTVLVVDDEPLVRATMIDLLEDLGYEVLDTYDGATALSLLGRNPGIGVLVTDIRMPDMDGVRLAHETRALRPDLAILITSGDSTVPHPHDFPFLPKPWRREQLRAALADLHAG
jgi:CheY-like chemotaxis protein